jgi:hypothetical protein
MVAKGLVYLLARGIGHLGDETKNVTHRIIGIFGSGASPMIEEVQPGNESLVVSLLIIITSSSSSSSSLC